MHTRACFRIVFLCAATLSVTAAETPKGTLDGFDDFMAKAMQEFKVPGAAVAVVQNGKVILAKGYGLSRLRRANNR